MFRVNVYRLDHFLKVVNDCRGPVNLVHQDGRKEDINKQYGIQRELQRQYAGNNGRIKMSLEIPEAKDYLDVVYYSIGNC